jgi:hypothetical protein
VGAFQSTTTTVRAIDGVRTGVDGAVGLLAAKTLIGADATL